MPQSKNLQPFTGLGSQSYEITHDDFMKGISTNDDANDAGFSANSTGIDIHSKPGIVRPVNAATAVMSTANTTFIATCDVLGTPYMKFFLGADKTLYGYKTDGTVAAIGPSGGSEVYSVFNTDMVQMGASIYFSSATDINKWNGTTFDNDWFSTTSGGAALSSANPHPLLVKDKRLYVADGNIIRLYDIDSNTSSLVFSTTTEMQIIALGIDPASGRMLISFNINNANSGLTKSSSYVGYYDGFNPTQLLKKIQVDESVTGFYNVGGTVFVVYGQNLGIWNGNGIEFLRRLNSSQAYSSVTTKQKITNMGHVLLLVDGTNILAYGETIPGVKAFSNLQTLTGVVNTIACIGPNQSSGTGYTIVFGNDTTGALNKFTIGQTLAGTGTFYSNDKHFQRPANVRAIDVFLDGIPGGSSSLTFTYNDDTDTNHDCSTSNTMTTAMNLRKKRFMFSTKTTSIQFKIAMSACNRGIKRILVYYDFAE